MRRRPLLTDAQWARIAPHLPKPKANPRGGRPRADDRACLEGILWVLRTGARWRDLPEWYPGPRRAGAGWASGNSRRYGSRCGTRS